MTCNIGFKSHKNNIFIAADNRITWKIPKRRDTVHVDDLQKIYLPTPNIAISFAGNNVENIKKVLEKFSNLARENFQYKIKNARTTYNYNDSIKRLLKRTLKISKIREKIYLLVGISFPKHSEKNKLIKYEVDNDDIQTKKEITTGNYCVHGSIENEKNYSDFKEEVLEESFARNKNLDICQYSALFHSKYLDFYHKLDEKFKTVGALFHSVHTRNGEFIGSDSESFKFDQKGTKIKISLKYDSKNTNFIQVNHYKNKEMRLISLEDYDLESVPKNNFFKLI